MTDLGNGHQRHHMTGQLIVLFVYLKLLLPAFCCVKLSHQLFKLLFYLIKVHTLIRHILKFHVSSSID